MFYGINTTDVALPLSERLLRLNQWTVSCLKTAWQIMTAEKTQRCLKAFGLAAWVVGIIVLSGMFEVGRLAVKEATIAFQTQLNADVLLCLDQETDTVGVSDTIAIISPQSGVRLLRQIATQQGILNAGRMRKPELLAVLELG
jgi:hypothetical protein